MTNSDILASDLRVVIGQLIRRLRVERRDVSLAQVTVLGRLDREGATTTSALAAGERVRPQSMASTVASLVDAGMVSRRADPGDGRRMLIELTPQGRETIVADRKRREGWLADAIARDFSEDERKVLAQATALLGRLTS